MLKGASSSEGGWWNDGSDSSSESSYSTTSSNNSSCPDWEEEVTPQGELYYVVRYPKPTQAATSATCGKPDQDVATPTLSSKDAPSDKPPSGLLVKLMRRKSSTKRSVRQIEETTSGLTHSTHPPPLEGDTYSVRVSVRGVTGWPKPNQSLLEARLGLIAQPYKNRLLIRAFSPDMMSFYQPTLCLGDWLYSVDGVLVTPDNIDSVLETIITPKHVILKIKSMKSKKGNGSFLRKKGVLSLKQGGNWSGGGVGSKNNSGWLVYVSSGCGEGNITYRFPSRPVSHVPAPGAFITLSHLLSTLVSSFPRSSKVCINSEMVNVIYTEEANDVLLVCLPAHRVSRAEALCFNDELVRCLKFNFKSLARCFSSKEVSKVSVDEIISNFFRRASSPSSDSQVKVHFDSLLPGAHYLPLPKKIQVQLGDALNELESNDIKQYEGKRLYSVVGTCLIHKGYVVRNQSCDIKDLYSYLKCCHLLELIEEGVQDMVVWKQVYPTSNRESTSVLNQPYTLQPTSRRYLLAVAQEHDMLVVLYESGGCTLRVKGNSGPDAIYVEEAQATLEHIQGLGFSKYVSKWVEMNNNFVQMERSKSTDSQLSDSKSSARSVRLADSQRYSFEYPPVSGYQGGVRVRSWSLPSVSAQALSGRLSADKISCTSAEQQSVSLRSESDLSEETETRDQRSLDSGSLYEWNDFGKNLLQEPASLPLARNGRLLQWVQVDSNSGLIVSNLDTVSTSETLFLSRHYQSVISVFRKLCYQVHAVLNRSTSLKVGGGVSCQVESRAAMQDISEHGILFELPTSDDNKRTNQLYWAVGRKTASPDPRELYVCYEDSCPQNIIEVAFRVALNAYL